MEDISAEGEIAGKGMDLKQELLMKVQADVDRALARREQMQPIIESLPDGIPARVVALYAWNVSPRMCLEVDRREQVEALLRVLPPEPMVLIRKSTGADSEHAVLVLAGEVEGMRREMKEGEEIADVVPVVPFCWRLNYATHHKSAFSEVDWTTRVRDQSLMDVEVTVRKDPAHVVEEGEGPADQCIRLEGAPQGEMMSHVGERPRDIYAWYTVYWRQGVSAEADNNLAGVLLR